MIAVIGPPGDHLYTIWPAERLQKRGDSQARSVVDVWRVALDVDERRRQALAGALSPAEQERAARLRAPTSRHRYVVAHGTLRAVLARYLDQDPGSVPLATGEHGKPFLATGDDLRFNLSRAGGRALIAFARGCEVGVDLEHLDRRVDHEGLARRFFSTAERAQLATLPPQQRRLAFFAGWTRKEAFVKATGRGLSLSLHRFSVSLLPDQPARLLEVDRDLGQAAGWSLADLGAGAGEGYAAALAVEGSGATVSWPAWEDVDGLAEPASGAPVESPPVTQGWLKVR